jgi:hypothetical protein
VIRLERHIDPNNQQAGATLNASTGAAISRTMVAGQPEGKLSSNL